MADVNDGLLLQFPRVVDPFWTIGEITFEASFDAIQTFGLITIAAYLASTALVTCRDRRWPVSAGRGLCHRSKCCIRVVVVGTPHCSSDGVVMKGTFDVG